MKRANKILITISILVMLFAAAFFVANMVTNFAGLVIYESQPDAGAGIDTYLRGGSNTNYGTGTTFRVGKTVVGVEFRGLIQMDVSSISSTDTVIDSKLQLYLSNPGENNMTIKAYRISSPWIETEAGWNNASLTELWNSVGGDYLEELDSVEFSNESGYYNFTITSATSGWVNGSYNNYGVLLLSESAADGDIHELSYSDESISEQRPKIIVNHVPNARPTIENISTDSSLVSPKQIGEQVTFTTYWSDLENDDTQMFICDSSNIGVSGCANQTFCSTSSPQANPAECSHVVSLSNNRTTSFWVAICDDNNCSIINQSQFYVNHVPTILAVQPNGGETVNQSQGDYEVRFNVSDLDSDLLTASIYYGNTQGSTANIIDTNLSLSAYCTDLDTDTSTTNNCTYPWDSTGIYGTFYLTIIIEDNHSTSNDSSDNSFLVRSLIDVENPQITAQWTDSGIYSGKAVQFYANVSDLNINTVWISINTTPQINLTLANMTAATYVTNWTAQEMGTYSFKTYANDTVENLNDSMPWTEFIISKPVAITQNELSPSTVLPYTLIKVTGELSATDPLESVYAYLNVPEGFTFVSGYPQNLGMDNFSGSEVKIATWFLSSPLLETTYDLNITYTDNYANSWNSSNTQVEVTSAIGGGYSLELADYPEVEATGSYYAEASFEQSGTYVDPDSIEIIIYDPARNLIPTSDMVKIQTGVYNYSYSVGSAPMAGQWETIINATKSSVSYYTNDFWKVVGALFDVKNIQILDAQVSNLNISIYLENIGNNPTDMNLNWNLTRVDTGEVLDSGADTIGVGVVPVTHNIYPTTAYVGQLKITFVGYYPDPTFDNKAGAYKIFSTTDGDETPVTPPVVDGGSSGGGGGGGSSTTSEAETEGGLEIEDFQSVIYLSKNIEKNVSLDIYNSGSEPLTNLSLTLEELPDIYSVSPQVITQLEQGERAVFTIKFLAKNPLEETDFIYKVRTNELIKIESGKLTVMGVADFFEKETELLRIEIEGLAQSITDEGLLDELERCADILNTVDKNRQEEEFINAQSNLREATDCVAGVRASEKEEPLLSKIKMEEYWIWIAGSLMFVVIAIIVVFLYLMYKKLSMLGFVRDEEREFPQNRSKSLKRESFEDRIKDIEEKLG